MAPRKVAVVTGGNKGIGYAIVKGLCEKYDGDVYLTARDVGRGEAAVESIKKLGFNPLFHQLDITDQASVDTFRDFIKTKHGGVDVLINNAAIVPPDRNASVSKYAKEVIQVNYFGTLKVCDAFFPLLRKNARVINVSSVAGHLSRLPSTDLRATFKSETLDIPTVSHLMEKFVKDVEDGKHQEEGWHSSSYSVSKIGVSAVSFIQQRIFDAETPNRNISVNSIHPGYVDTDLSNHQGPLTIEEGASGILFLVLTADIKGKYLWRDGSVIDWDGPLAEPY